MTLMAPVFRKSVGVSTRSAVCVVIKIIRAVSMAGNGCFLDHTQQNKNMPPRKIMTNAMVLTRAGSMDLSCSLLSSRKK